MEQAPAPAAAAAPAVTTSSVGHPEEPHAQTQAAATGSAPTPAAVTDTPSVPAAAGAAPSGQPDAPNKPFDPIEALKVGGLRLANIIRAKGPAGGTAGQLQEQQHPGGAPAGEVVARIRATAAGLSAKAKEQGSRFYQASVSTAATTAEGIKRLALGEPLQALCRSEFQVHPCPQLVLAACTALVSGGGLTTERIFKHNPPPELVDRLAAAAGSLSLLPPGASPHAVAGLLKRFLLGLPEPLLTYRLLSQWVAAGDHPASCQALLPQLPAANAGTLKLLMQVCSLIHAEAAQNEMDSLALAEVLVPCMAWKPAPKPQGGQGGPGPLHSLAKALTLNKASGTAAAAAGLPAGGADAAAEGEAAAAAARGAADEQQQQQQMEEVSKVVPLEEAELEAVVTVVEHMISNYSSVFGVAGGSGGSSGKSISGGSYSNGNAAGTVV